jgi:glutathione S-transferase
VIQISSPSGRYGGARTTLVSVMFRLVHYPFCPFSRSIRLALGECGLVVELDEERPWAWRRDFLAINPAGTLPVLVERGGMVLAGAYPISEYLGETQAKTNGEVGPHNLLFPGDAVGRAEIRRMVDWFHRKFDEEVSRYLLDERLYQRFADLGRSTPDTNLIRAGRANLRYHMSYIDFLTETRKWLAGNAPSFADLAAGGHLSVLDYLGEVPWQDYPKTAAWYTKLKARASFRPLLADRLPGLAPANADANAEL